MGTVFHLDAARSPAALSIDLERVAEDLADCRRWVTTHEQRCEDLERRLVEGVVHTGARKGQPLTPIGRRALAVGLRKAAAVAARAHDRRATLDGEWQRLSRLVPRELWGVRAKYAEADPWVEVERRRVTVRRGRRA